MTDAKCNAPPRRRATIKVPAFVVYMKRGAQHLNQRWNYDQLERAYVQPVRTEGARVKYDPTDKLMHSVYKIMTAYTYIVNNNVCSLDSSTQLWINAHLRSCFAFLQQGELDIFQTIKSLVEPALGGVDNNAMKERFEQMAKTGGSIIAEKDPFPSLLIRNTAETWSRLRVDTTNTTFDHGTALKTMRSKLAQKVGIVEPSTFTAKQFADTYNLCLNLALSVRGAWGMDDLIVPALSTFVLIERNKTHTVAVGAFAGELVNLYANHIFSYMWCLSCGHFRNNNQTTFHSALVADATLALFNMTRSTFLAKVRSELIRLGHMSAVRTRRIHYTTDMEREASEKGSYVTKAFSDTIRRRVEKSTDNGRQNQLYMQSLVMVIRNVLQSSSNVKDDDTTSVARLVEFNNVFRADTLEQLVYRLVPLAYVNLEYDVDKYEKTSMLGNLIYMHAEIALFLNALFISPNLDAAAPDVNVHELVTDFFDYVPIFKLTANIDTVYTDFTSDHNVSTLKPAPHVVVRLLEMLKYLSRLCQSDSLEKIDKRALIFHS